MGAGQHDARRRSPLSTLSGLLSRLGALAATAALVLSLPGVASATPYWLDAPIPINQDGVVGSIIPVMDHTGLIHPTLQDGTFNAPTFAGESVFFFQIVLDAGSASIDGIGVTVASPQFFLNPTGAGVFDDSGSGKILPTAVAADNVVDLAGEFTFGTPLAAGETSTRMFIVHATDDMAPGQSVSLMISSGANFNVIGTIVPEPDGRLLMMVGLLVLAASSSGPRRRLVPHRASRR